MTAMELTDLFDGVLLDIAERLELPELCSLSLTCMRLNAVARTVAQHRYKHVDYMQLMQRYSNFCDVPCDIGFRSAMEFIGPLVQRILFNGELLYQHIRTSSNPDGPSCPTEYEDRYEHSKALTVSLRDFPRFDKLFPMIGRYFTQLSCIRIGRPAADWKTIEYVGKTVLHSEDFCVDDRHLTFIFNYWPVDELSVSHPDMYKSSGGLEWNSFNGKCLGELDAVKRLALHHCNKVQPQNFQTFCLANSERMTHLEINECTQLNQNSIVFTHISRNLFNMQHLAISFKDESPSLNSLVELTELRYLRLTMANEIDRLMENLAINDRLDHLHIVDCLIDFTSDGYTDDNFFTHLQTVSLSGNMLNSAALQRFGNAEHLREMRFNYEMDLEAGLVELVRQSKALQLLDIYCREWISLTTVERMIGVLRADLRANQSRPMLQLKLAYELCFEADRFQLEKLSKAMDVIAHDNLDVILITQLIPNIY